MFKNGVVVGNFQQERSMKNLVEFIKFHTKGKKSGDNDNNNNNNEDNNNDSDNSDEDSDDNSVRRNEVEEAKLVTLLDETFKVIVIYLKIFSLEHTWMNRLSVGLSNLMVPQGAVGWPGMFQQEETNVFQFLKVLTLEARDAYP